MGGGLGIELQLTTTAARVELSTTRRGAQAVARYIIRASDLTSSDSSKTNDSIK